jgi:hypothetical protein
MSGGEKFLAGFGKAFSDTGRGIKQVGAGIGNAVGLVGDSTVSALKQQEAESRARDAALMDTGAGLAGNVSGYVGQALTLPVGGLAAGASKAGLATAGGLLARAPAAEAALYGLAQGALMPTVEGESRAGNAALGGLMGYGGTKAMQLAGKALQAPGQMVDDAMRGASTSQYTAAVKRASLDLSKALVEIRR